MSEDKINSISLPPVEQIGIIVKDIDKTVEYYEKVFGWGPFNISEVSLEGCNYRGKPTDVRLKMAMAQSGPIEIELIQVMEGESIHSEFLRERGEGMQHVRFTVNNLDEILAEWAKEGIDPVWQHSYPEAGISWAYVNTDLVGGMMTELFEFKQV